MNYESQNAMYAHRPLTSLMCIFHSSFKCNSKNAQYIIFNKNPVDNYSKDYVFINTCACVVYFDQQTQACACVHMVENDEKH